MILHFFQRSRGPPLDGDQVVVRRLHHVRDPAEQRGVGRRGPRPGELAEEQDAR